MENDLYKGTIEKLYKKADQLVGQVMEYIHENDLLFIMSDHGFKPFKWGINLNTWLHKEGYLIFKDTAARKDRKWFMDIDWKKSKAYAFGLAGIYINTKGREKQGIISSGEEKRELAKEIKSKLESIYDENNSIRPIRTAYLAEEIYQGPYIADAPDIFVGYEEGYRTSWNSAIGKVSDSVFEINKKPWSGDHCQDPAIVPGVLFSNWKSEEENPSIYDIAPTVLDIFGIDKPDFQDGRILKFHR